MKDISKFTLRTEKELLRKFQYVAEFNARSTNKELEVVMKQHVTEFEKENGNIEFE